MEINKNEKEKLLLIETQKGEIEKVIQLINEEANINYKDDDGNTALHYAVRYGYLEIVKYLFKNGADSNIENSNLETPLDIAERISRPNIEEIEMAIYKDVLNKSFKLLENFVHEETWNGYTNSLEENANRDQNMLKEQILKEIKKKEVKIKSCLKSLKILNENENIANSYLTYEQANLFIFFLEAFTFKDPYIKEPEETQQEVKLGIQDYFAPHIPDLKGGRKLVDELRSIICNSPKTRITVEDIQTLLTLRIDINTLFKKLESYVSYICNNLDGKPNTDIRYVDVTSILQFDETIGREFISDSFHKEWEEFIEAIHQEEQWTKEQEQEMLFNFLVNISPVIEKDADNFVKVRNEIIDELPNFDIKKKFKEIFHLNIYSHKLYVKSMKMIGKRKDKIKLCLEYLKDVNKDINTSYSKFTYKQANIFILFLDTFIFRNEDEEFENYFKLFIPGFYDDQIVIKGARQCLCQGSNKFISVEDVKTLVIPELDVAAFFKKLEDYVTNVYNIINCLGTVNKTVYINSILDINMDVGTDSNDMLKEILSNLINLVGRKEEWTQERTQEILFNFLVNISEEYTKEVSGLASLRKMVITTFHEYKDVESILRLELMKAVFKLRSILFKYYYAKEIIKVFHQIKPSDDYNKIDSYLKSSLHKMEEDFQKSFKGEQKLNTSPQEKSERDFEDQFFQSSINSNQKELALKALIIQYFKYMIIVDDEISEKYFEIPVMYKNFNIRRFLLNDFLNLRHLKSSSPKKYFEEKKDLRDSLVAFNGVKEVYYNDICQLYIENDSCKKQVNDQIERSIIDTILSLYRLQSYFNISNPDVISLYKRFVEGNDELDLDKNSDLLTSLSESEKCEFNKKLKKQIKNWSKMQFIEATFDKKIVKVNVVKFISNVLKTFNNIFNSYNIKFVILKEAFNNEDVIQNMVVQEQTDWKTKVLKSGNFGYYLFMIFKKLMNLKYTAPYIARVQLEERACNVMEMEDFKKLTEILSDDDQYISHLNELLKVSYEGVDLYEIVWKKLFYKNWANMSPIFEDPNHLKEIFKHLQNSLIEDGNDRIQELERNLLTFLNNVVEHLFSIGENNKALEIVKIYTKHPIGDKSLAKLELLKGKHWKLRIINWLGVLSRRENDSCVIAVELQKVAIEKCNELKSELDEMQSHSIEFSVLYLLNLSILAYVQHSLENYEESFHSYENMYLRISNFTLYNESVTNQEPIGEERSNDFVEIVQCKKYNDLLCYSEEASQYLDIMKIRISMAWTIIWNWTKHHNSFQTLNTEIQFYTESLELFKEIYTIKRLEHPEDHEIANIMWKIAFMNGSLSKAKEKLKRRYTLQEVFRHQIESLQFYNRAYNVQKGYVISSNTTLKNIFRVLHVIAGSRNSFIGWEGTNAIQSRLNKIREPLTEALQLTNYIQKYRNQN